MAKCSICGSDIVGKRLGSIYCSSKCRNRAGAIKEGRCLDHGLLTKTCVVCGEEFQTFKSRKVTCSDECSKKNKGGGKKPYNYEKDHAKYVRKHPNARTREEISAESIAKKEKRAKEVAKRQAEREAEWERIRAEKERKKQENIDYWLNYEAEHECEVCGKTFTAYYPTTKYCSDKCRKAKYRRKKRYKGITIDSDISLFKLAERDHNQCQICGLFVDWNDYIKTENTTICGDMYPSIDHVRPISLGGLHSWNNVQLAHRGCNSKKQNKYIG